MSLITSAQRFYVNNLGVFGDNLEEVGKEEFLTHQARKRTSSSLSSQSVAAKLALLAFASQISQASGRCVGATCTTTLTTMTPLTTTTTPQPTPAPTTSKPPTTTSSTTRTSSTLMVTTPTTPSPTTPTTTTTTNPTATTTANAPPTTPTSTSKTGLSTSTSTLNPAQVTTINTSTLDQTVQQTTISTLFDQTTLSGLTNNVPGVTTSTSSTTSVSTSDQTVGVGMTRSTSMPDLISITEDVPSASSPTAINSSIVTSATDAENESLDQASNPPNNSGLIAGSVVGVIAFIASAIGSVAAFLKLKSKNKDEDPELGRAHPELEKDVSGEGKGIPGYGTLPAIAPIPGYALIEPPKNKGGEYDKVKLQSGKNGRYNVVQAKPDSHYKSAFANKGYDEATTAFKTGDEELVSARMDDEAPSNLVQAKPDSPYKSAFASKDQGYDEPASTLKF